MSGCLQAEDDDDSPEVTDNEVSHASEVEDEEDDDDDSESDLGPTIQTDPTAENYNKWKAQGYWTLTFNRTFPNQTESSLTFSVETNVEPHPLLKQLLAHYSSGPASRHLNAPVVAAEREDSPTGQGQPTESPHDDEYQCPHCQEQRETTDNQSNNANDDVNNQNQQGVEYTRGSRGSWSMTFERTFSDMSKSGFSVESDVEPHPLVEKLWHYYEDTPASNFLQPRVESSEVEPREWLNQNCQPMTPERGPRDYDDDEENIYEQVCDDSDEGDREEIQELEVVHSEEEEVYILEPVIVENRGQQVERTRQQHGIQALLKMENILKKQESLVDKQRETLVTHQNALAELEEEINQYIDRLAVTKSDLKRCSHSGCDMAYKWRALGKALENYKKGLMSPCLECNCHVNWTAFEELKESVTNVFGEGALKQEVAMAGTPNGNPLPSSEVGSRHNSLDEDWLNF